MRYFLQLAFVAFLFHSCSEPPIPKPSGYFRVDLPEKAYNTYVSECRFSIDVPKYSKVNIFKDRTGSDSCWFNIDFPRLNATVYCTYFSVNNDVDELVKEAYNFAAKHELKATALKRTPIEEKENKVFGILYDIEGEAASQVQFFVTDSTSNFFRGSLYFNNRPNPDSIAPVLNFVREDILRMAHSVKWNVNGSPLE